MSEFPLPTRQDLDRSLARFVDDRFGEMLAERTKVMDTFIKANGFTNSKLPLSIADTFEKMSRSAMDDVIEHAWPYLGAAADGP